ncbi:uncharacterized protein LOC143324275 [Chaetodon auriga]|uniref:uncharacterized protein LOC143324274 n=1 Tax=Chaetodon auriga TaxID=39042 RepID=UPI004032C411
MPRKGRRSTAAKLRWRKLNLEELSPSSPPLKTVQRVSPPAGESREPNPSGRGSRTRQTHPPCSRAPVSNLVGSSPPTRPFWSPDDVRADFRARSGTGYRHRVQRWPMSPFTGRSHKLAIPPETPDKKFVLIVGDSHLRAIVDGLVAMPEGSFSFGVMSTPGASASQLRTEVLHAVLPRIPEAVCVVAPSNNLTTSRTIDEAAVDYAKLLTAVRSRWSKVFVVDFPPRLTVEESYQDLLRQEYHRVAACMGVRYFSTVDHFPLTRLELWSRDGVHLSDREGMGILVQLLWSATKQQLETPSPTPRVSPRPSQPLRKVSPKLVVRGEVPAPPSPDPFEWRLAGQGGKKSQPGEPSQSQGSAQTRMAQQLEKECFLPLNPVWFSSTVLRAMEDVSPSHLSCLTDCKPPPKFKRVASSAAARRRRTTDRPPHSHRSPVHDLVGSPPSRLSWGSEEEAPASPAALAQMTASPVAVRRSRTKDGHPPHTQTSVNNLAGSPPAKLSWSLGDAATPCCSPAAKMARINIPSPAGPSWTITDAGCDPASPAKAPQTPTPSSAAWPWFISDAPSTSRSPANEWMTSVPTVKMQTKLLVPTSSIRKNNDHRPRRKTSRGPQLRTVLPSRQVFNALYYCHTSSCHVCLHV